MLGVEDDYVTVLLAQVGKVLTSKTQTPKVLRLTFDTKMHAMFITMPALTCNEFKNSFICSELVSRFGLSLTSTNLSEFIF